MSVNQGGQGGRVPLENLEWGTLIQILPPKMFQNFEHESLHYDAIMQ